VRLGFVSLSPGSRQGVPNAIITLPLQISVRATKLFFRVAEDVAGRTLSAAGLVVGAVAARRGTESEPWSTGDPTAQSAEARQAAPPPRQPALAPAPPPRPTPTPPPAPRVEPLAAAPAHVSEEPELVREEAEPGAEDGAGAQIRVDQPWDGYKRMTANQVIERLGQQDAAGLAAVALYERSHRARRTVIQAVDRALRSVNGSTSSPQ
jgi:hypothetical protein